MIGQWIRKLKSSHKTLGLEITDSQVKVCEIRDNGKRVKVTRFASIELPAGTMNDGKIMDESALRLALQKLMTQHPWSSRYVHFAIPSQTVMIRFLKLPDVRESALRKIVDYEVRNNILFPFNEIYYDFIKYKKPNDNVEQQDHVEHLDNVEQQDHLCDVMLVAAPMELLQQYINLIEQLQLIVASIEIKAFSLFRLETRCLRLPGPGLRLLVDVNDTSCDLTFIYNDTIQLTRNVPAAFSAKQTPSMDAQDNLFSEFITQTVDHSAIDHSGSMYDLMGEIERFINFYTYTLNHRDQVLERVIVSGDISTLNELIGLLKERLTNVRVVPVNWQGLLVEQNQNEMNWNIAHYAVPLGLSLRGKI